MAYAYKALEGFIHDKLKPEDSFFVFEINKLQNNKDYFLKKKLFIFFI
jgi:hypothetical protein